MTEEEMILYYDDNLEEIFKNDLLNENLDFIGDFVSDLRIQDLLKTWPEDIKVRVVEKYLQIEETRSSSCTNEDSWGEYYEMYDGKFDETNNLLIKIKKVDLQNIKNLGYKEICSSKNNLTINIGDYYFDESGNIVITHSCPDREIFGGDLNQHLDELAIKSEWVVSTSLTNIKFTESK